jgi:hypothetical protein
MATHDYIHTQERVRPINSKPAAAIGGVLAFADMAERVPCPPACLSPAASVPAEPIRPQTAPSTTPTSTLET